MWRWYRAGVPRACAFQLVILKSRAFVLLRRARYFSFACPKEKYPRENDTPASALSGLPVRKVRVRVAGFVDRASCPDAKLVGIRTDHPAGFPSPARRCRGAPGKATRILRVLFRRAGSPAPSPQPSPRRCRGEGAERQASRTCARQLLSSSALAVAQRRHTECGPGWPAALPGAPCAAVRWGRQAAQRASTRRSMPFRPDRSPVEKPGPNSRTCRAGARQAPSGVAFSLVTFSWPRKRK